MKQQTVELMQSAYANLVSISVIQKGCISQSEISTSSASGALSMSSEKGPDARTAYNHTDAIRDMNRTLTERNVARFPIMAVQKSEIFFLRLIFTVIRGFSSFIIRSIISNKK